MTRRGWLVALLAVWVLVFAGSVLVPWLTEPRGDGFTRGLNQLMTFFGYQLAAGAVALGLWWISRGVAPAWLRWLARVPLMLALALALFVAGLILWANLSRPERPEAAPPMTPTEPVRPVAPDRQGD